MLIHNVESIEERIIHCNVGEYESDMKTQRITFPLPVENPQLEAEKYSMWVYETIGDSITIVNSPTFSKAINENLTVIFSKQKILRNIIE